MADETEVETVTRIQAVDIRDLYPELAPEDATSRVCLLCGAKLKDKTHNLTRHLERHHAGALLQLLEQRNQASPSVLATRTRRAQQEKTAAPARQPAGTVEDALLKAGDAKLALARWLAQEQLPVDLIEKSGFREFIEALNEQFSPPKQEELRQLLETLVAGRDDAKLSIDSNGVIMDAAGGNHSNLVVEMMALRATCRCSEDSPLVAYSRIACDIVEGGEAKVRVLRAAASLFDAQVCRGGVLGRNGVLGRSFVGVVTEMQPSVTQPSDVSMTGAAIDGPVQLFTKVVASPYITVGTGVHQQQQEQNHQPSHAKSSLRNSNSSTSCLGVSASSGALSEYIVLPVSNLCVVPPEVPDDLALLADDIAVVLSIANELQRRHVTNVAILSDGPATILSSLLTRYLHQDLQAPAHNLHVFTTSLTHGTARNSSTQTYCEFLSSCEHGGVGTALPGHRVAAAGAQDHVLLAPLQLRGLVCAPAIAAVLGPAASGAAIGSNGLPGAQFRPGGRGQAQRRPQGDQEAAAADGAPAGRRATRPNVPDSGSGPGAGAQEVEEVEAVEPGKRLLDGAFAALERAQQSRDKTAALELYKEAESGFYEAEKVVLDERSREFLRARRGDLQKTIRGLERDMLGAATFVAPAQVVASPATPQVKEVVTASPAMDISARLEELRRFAAQQDAVETQQGSRTDLAARLAALKSERAGPAPPVDALAERLRRLRGDNGQLKLDLPLEMNGRARWIVLSNK
ncbi:hypothetical protein ON010_g16537 [Phytophthora cinnamomi]|nr:hypothetical protein ON010_g16537 [Phytophthora cinnamomi]